MSEGKKSQERHSQLTPPTSGSFASCPNDPPISGMGGRPARGTSRRELESESLIAAYIGASPCTFDLRSVIRIADSFYLPVIKAGFNDFNIDFIKKTKHFLCAHWWLHDEQPNLQQSGLNLEPPRFCSFVVWNLCEYC